MNAVEIEEEVSKLAAMPFDRAEFAYLFLGAFGNKDVTLKRLRSGSTNASDVNEGVLQRNNIHIATCDIGKVDDTLSALRNSPKTAALKAKFIVATDGDLFGAEEVDSNDAPIACEYAKFHDYIGFFLPLAGITTVRQIRESSFDIKATGRLNRLYVELLRDNPDWAKAERRPDMNHFMARLIFCFFAEDTDIFRNTGLFTATVQQFSASDSSNTHEIIANIFRAMNTKPEDHKSAGIPPHADAFPYVNGGLFSGSTDVPKFSKMARSYLLNIGTLDWTKINPDIFGSMIQAVADDDGRGALGMHYTSVPNILKVLNPLFLDELRAQLEEAGDNARKLLNLRGRMAKIRVFDPACGSGNFLVIAYKEMRAIEAQINTRRNEPDRRTDLPLTNYRGIELRDFPAEIARLALIIAEYQCDVTYRGQKEALAEFLPLDAQNWITCGNALRLDWLSICPPTGTGVKVQADDLFGTPLDQAEIDFENEGGETYICGNPPYLGKGKKEFEHLGDMEWIFAKRAKQWGYVDYVGCWLVKAADYCRLVDNSSSALVATNSVCQGRQVSQLWPSVIGNNIAVNFAHLSFKWNNSAMRNAGVICTIIGIRNTKYIKSKFIFEGENVRKVNNINTYLIDGPDVYVESTANPISSLPKLITGSVPNDGGNLLFSPTEKIKIVSQNPELLPYFKRFVWSQDLIRGLERSCMLIGDADAEQVRKVPEISKRLDNVVDLRRNSPKKETRDILSLVPHRFQHLAGLPQKSAIVIPSVSSESRDYFPVGYLSNDTIVSNLAFFIIDPPI